MSSNMIFGLILCIVSIVIIYYYYGIKKGFLIFSILFLIGGIIAFIPEYFGDIGKYVLLTIITIIIIIALIVNVKSIKEPLLKKIRQLLQKK